MLVVCLFLPALEVCDKPEIPLGFPPCYGAYVGGIGVMILAIAQSRTLLRLGLAITPVLAVLTVGCIALVFKLPTAAMIGLTAVAVISLVSVVRWVAYSPLGERSLATVSLVQGLGSSLWAGVLVANPEGLWGSVVALVAGIALVIASGAWLFAIPLDDAPT